MPLHVAVYHNRKPIIHELLAMSNSCELINDINSNGYSPIYIGLKHGLGDIMMNLVSPLLAHCNSHSLFLKDSHGNNYVHLTTASSNSKILLEFLEFSNCHKLLNDTNVNGVMPLHSAASKGQTHCIKLLLNRGAMVHKCYKGITPLMVTCSSGHIDCAKLLYKAHPFQINWQDNNGNTALHYAAQPLLHYAAQMLLHTFSLSIFALYGSVDSSQLGNQTDISSNSSHQRSTQVSSNFGQVMRYIALSSNILLMSLLLTASIRLRFSVLNAQTLFCFMSTFFSSGFLFLSTIIGLAALPVSLPGFFNLGTGIFQLNRCICRNVLQDSS